MKILVIAESIDIEDSSGSKANVALIKSMVQAGFLVRVLHYTKKEIQIDAFECIAIAENRRSFLFFLSRIQRVFSRVTGIHLNRFLESLFGFSFTFFNDTKSISKAIKKENHFDPNLILTLSKGASFRPHYAMLNHQSLHEKWMAYVHDPYPFHYYPRPYNWIEPGYAKKEQFFKEVSEKAAFAAFPSLLLKEWMGSYFPNFLKNGVVIPHQSVPYEIKNKTLPEYFRANDFTVLHAGSLMKQRSPEGLLDAFEIFLAKNPEAKENSKLYLIGPAYYYEELLKRHENNKNIYIKNGSLPFDAIYNLQKNASVNVILESKSEISPFLPAKFPHCIEAQKPILLLSPFYSESKRLLGNEYSFWSEVDDIEGIVNNLELLFFKWKDRQEKPNYSLEILNRYLGSENVKLTIEQLVKCE